MFGFTSTLLTKHHYGYLMENAHNLNISGLADTVTGMLQEKKLEETRKKGWGNKKKSLRKREKKFEQTR